MPFQLEITESIQDQAKEHAERINKNPTFLQSDYKTSLGLITICRFLDVDFTKSVPAKGKFINYKDKKVGAKLTKYTFGGILYKEKHYFTHDYCFLCLMPEPVMHVDLVGVCSKEMWEDKAEEVALKFGPTFQVKNTDLMAPETFKKQFTGQISFLDDDIPF